MIKNTLILIAALIILGCNNKSSQISHEKIGDLKNTKWIHQPFKENKDCIDTLIFISNLSGLDYSCEHDFHDSITYQIFNDTLLIDKYDYVSEVDLDQGLEIVSKYILIKSQENLIIVDIKHKHLDKFESVDPKIFIGKTYKKLE